MQDPIIPLGIETHINQRCQPGSLGFRQKMQADILNGLGETSQIKRHPVLSMRRPDHRPGQVPHRLLFISKIESETSSPNSFAFNRPLFPMTPSAKLLVSTLPKSPTRELQAERLASRAQKATGPALSAIRLIESKSVKYFLFFNGFAILTQQARVDRAHPYQ